MVGVTKTASSIVQSSKNFNTWLCTWQQLQHSISQPVFFFESMEKCRNARSVLHGFFKSHSNYNKEISKLQPTHMKNIEMCFFSLNHQHLQIRTNTNYSEQLCHMECNSTAKLTCLRERKRVAPRLAINFNNMANAWKWFQGCLQLSGEAGAGRCCALLAMFLWSHPLAAVTKSLRSHPKI